MDQQLYKESIQLIQEHKFELALDKINQAIIKNSSNFIYYSTRAGILNCLFRFEESVIDTKKAIEMDPTFAKSYIQQGFAYFKSGNYKQSLKSYLRAQKIEPENSMLQNLINKVNKQLDELKLEEEEEQQQAYAGQEDEQDWLKDIYTKISMHKDYCQYLENSQFVFQLELLDKSPQLWNVLIKNDRILKMVLENLTSNESNLTAQQQKENNQNKDIMKEELDKQQKYQYDLQEIQQTKLDKQQKQIEVQNNKQDNNDTKNSGELGTLENMENVFSLMSQQIKTPSASDDLMKIFGRMNIAVQEPGNILEQENKKQKQKQQNEQINLTQQSGNTQGQVSQHAQISNQQAYSSGTGSFQAQQGGNRGIFMPDNFQREMGQVMGKITYSTDNQQSQTSISSANMVSIGQSFDFNQELEKQKKEEEIKQQQQQEILQKEKKQIQEDMGISIRRKPKVTEQTNDKKKEKVFVTRTVGTSDVFEGEQEILNKQQIEFHKKEGVTLLNQKKYGNAIVEFNKALKLDPKDFQILVYKVNTLIQIQNYGQAHLVVDDLIQNNIGNKSRLAISNQLKAVIFEKEENYQQAKIYYSKSNDLEPSKNIQLQLQHISMVIQDLNKYQDENYKKVTEHIKVGDQLFSVGKFEYAIDEYKEGLKIDSKNADLWLKKSNCEIKLRKLNDGLNSINECLKLDHKKEIYWLKKGYIHIFLKEYKMSQASFELGLDQYPDHQELLKGLQKAKELVQEQQEMENQDPKKENLKQFFQNYKSLFQSPMGQEIFNLLQQEKMKGMFMELIQDKSKLDFLVEEDENFAKIINFLKQKKLLQELEE